MSNQFIKISFSDAKLFTKNPRTKDFVTKVVVDKKGKQRIKHSKRKDRVNGNFKEPITVYQVSNMLHTLIGERPIPSFRKVNYTKNEKVFDLANRSYIRINTPKTEFKRKDVDVSEFISEKMSMDKSPWNAFSEGTLNWFKIKKYLGEDFNQIINMLNDAFKYDITKKTVIEFRSDYIKMSDKPNLNNVIEKLKELKKGGLVDFFMKSNFNNSRITNNIKSGLGETVVSGIDNTQVLNGSILVPYENWFVSKLIKNTTNILDGGFVIIEKIINEYELNDSENYKLINEISTEKF